MTPSSPKSASDLPTQRPTSEYLKQVTHTVTEWLKAGMVLRWVPHTELGRKEEDGRGLFVNRTEIAEPDMGMAIAELCGKRGPFKCVERGGFGYVELR